MAKRQADYQLRLDRALHHLESLEKQQVAFAESHAETLVNKFNPQRGEYVITVKSRKPSPELALTISECLHALRVSLDNLVYALVLANHRGRAVPPGVERRCEFPIFGTRPMNARERELKIGGITPKARAVIERFQPHFRRPTFLESDPLWVLSELENIDKHRRLNVVSAVLHSSGLRPPARRFSIDHIHIPPVQPFERRTEIVAYRVLVSGKPVKVDFDHSFGVAFPKSSPGDGQSVVLTLGMIYAYIDGSIVPALKPFL